LLTLVELLVQRVRALYLSGDENDALRTLSEALSVAAPESMIRAFLDEGESLQPLLLSLQQRGEAAELESAALAHLQTLLGAIQLPDGSSFGKRSDHGTVLEPLTKRELQILRMIDGGLSNRQLAQSLFVSEGTVKWHLHNLYNKLSVRSRSGAIAKARRLTLLR
jgi:LuxR family maltose regulon positive regulatory protein